MLASHPQLSKHLRQTGALGLWALLLAGLYLAGLRSYLLFHSLAEIFGIAVTCAVFLLAWNARSFMEDSHLLFLGCVGLGVAALELLHTLAYKGMGVFPQAGANLPTQLWTASRFLQATAFLLLPWVLGRRLRPPWLLAAVLVVTGLLGLLVFSGHFPDCYREGQGLTPFKTYSEYLACLMLLAAAGGLWRRGQGLHPRVRGFLLAAMGFSLAQGLAFSSYVGVYGQANLAGHLLGIGSALMIYKAVIETGLRQPMEVLFSQLRASEQDLKRSRQTASILLNAPHEAALLLDRGLKVLAANQLAAQRLAGPGQDPEALVGRDFVDLLPAGLAVKELETLGRAVLEGQPQHLESRRGQRVFAESTYPILGEDGKVEQLALYSRDVTARRRQEAERERLLSDLTKAAQDGKAQEGLLPICAGCKRVRDEHGGWESIEAYLNRQLGNRVTHGLCPDCARKLYPELYP